MDILEVLKISIVTMIVIVIGVSCVEIIQKSYYKSVFNKKMYKSNMESIEEIKKELMEQIKNDLKNQFK